jgi:uncharacterized membrane protein YheB (UPF0754 family)
MNTYLLWIVPPLAGALIGYVTNAVAVKMLFRPLREIRVFGIRLPFTPGVLPRQRRRLADNIGAMVERELLTEEILKARLRREDVRSSLAQSLAAYTAKYMGASFRDILGSERSAALEQKLDGILTGELRLSAGEISSLAEVFLDEAYPRLTVSLIKYLERPEIREQMEIHGRIFLNNAILKLNVLQRFFLSAGQYDKTLHERMGEIITDFIRQFGELLEDRDIRRKLTAFAGSLIQDRLSEEHSAVTVSRFINRLISPLFDRPLGETLMPLFGCEKEQLDLLIRDKLLKLAEEQSGAALKTVNIRALVSERIDSMDMLSVERIVLDVMSSQLKWINFFGAILGALIGTFQALFSWFTK